MARKPITFDTVRELGLVMPDVEEGTTYGTPALKVRGKMFVCVTSHKSAEPGTIAVRIGFEERDEVLAAEPDIYYLKDHYENYPVVLVRLARIPKDALRDLLLMAHRLVSSTGPRRKSAPKRRIIKSTR